MMTALVAKALSGHGGQGQGLYLPQGGGEPIDAGALPVILKVHPAMCEGRLMLHEQVFPPRMLVPAHVHERAAQFSVVTQGCLSVLVGTEVHTLEAGDFIWRPAGAVHAIWNTSPDQPARQVEGSLPGQAMLSFFRDFEELTQSGGLSPAALAEVAAPYGTSYQEDVTAWIEDTYDVSARGWWRL